MSDYDRQYTTTAADRRDRGHHKSVDDAIKEMIAARPQREAEREQYRQNLALSREMADDYGATYTGKSAKGGRRRRRTRRSRKSRKSRRTRRHRRH